MWQNETQQTRKYQSRQNMSLETRNRFAQLQNTQDIEAKNYKVKETLQHRHQISVYTKQNHRPYPFGQRKTVPRNSTCNDALRNDQKTLIVGASMIRSIKMKEVNKTVTQLVCKTQIGSTRNIKTSEVLFVPSLIDETLDRIILLGGCNDMSITKNQHQKRLHKCNRRHGDTMMWLQC